MRNLVYMVSFCLLFVTGCILFGEPSYVDAQGVLHQAAPGLIDDVIAGLTVASPFAPYLGAIAAGLGIIGGVGTSIVSRKKLRDNAEATVKLVDGIKKDARNLTNDEDVIKLVDKHIPKDTAYGKLVHSVYERLKKNGDIE